MTNIELFFLLLFTSGVTIISYKNYAQPRGWPVGAAFDSDSSILKMAGMLAIAGSFIAAFFFVKWYLVLLGAVAGWLLSGALTAILRQHTQIFSIILLVASWVLLFIAF